MWLAFFGVGLLASNSPPARPVRATVSITVVDRDYIHLHSTQPIVQISIDDLYENTDYILDIDPATNEARIRMMTFRGPLRINVETKVPGARKLKRTFVHVVENPKHCGWD